MSTNAAALHLLDASGKAHGQPFLWSHRAHAVCTREFARLTGHLAGGFAQRHAGGLGPKPVVRQAPNRFIVQVGTVALTLAWLRTTLDHVGDGELLAIVWSGTVAQRGDPIPERRAAAVTSTPVNLWEDTLKPDADQEATWAWSSRNAPGDAVRPSPALAEDLIARVVHAAAAMATVDLPA